MARISQNGVQATPKEVMEFDTYFQQSGTGRGLCKFTLILAGGAALITGAICGTKALIKRFISPKESKPGKNPSGATPSTSVPKSQPVDTPYEEVPPTPIEDPRQAAIGRLLGGEDGGDLTEITPEMLASAPDTNVMQGIIHQGINLILAEKKCGKTVLGVHLGVSLAKGIGSDLFSASGDNRVVRQRVIYYDTETFRSTMKSHHGETLKDVLDNGFYLREGKPGWEKLLKDMAEQVLDHQRDSKDITLVLDCIYEYPHHEVEMLRKGAKRLCTNAREQYGCNLTVLMVTHLDDKGKPIGSQNLQRTAVTWIYLERVITKEPKGKKGTAGKTVRTHNDTELLGEVAISWSGRNSKAGRIICVAKGEAEGYPGNLHYEVKPLDWKEAKQDIQTAREIEARAEMAYESYAQEHNIQKPDSRCLDHVVKTLLAEYNVAVNPETVRTWLKNYNPTGN